MSVKDSGFFLPRAVIFDWDNTLVDSWGDIGEAINDVRAHYRLQTWNRAEILANCTRSAREAFPDWFGDKWSEACDRYYKKFDEVRARSGLHALNGALDLIAWLHEQKIPSLVVSNKSGEILRREVEEIGWKQYFVSVVGAKDALKDKPAREHADKALQLAGLQTGGDILFVGDSEADIACARNAECTPCLIGAHETAQRMHVNLHAQDCAQLLVRLKMAA